MMKLLLVFAVAVAGICHCTSSCTVTQSGTLFTLSEFTAPDCYYYSWINDSGSVLVAEDGTKHKSVVDSNITFLLMNGCHQEIKYYRFCSSENRKEHVTCHTNCTSMVPQNKGKEADVKDTTRFRISWIVLCLLLLLVMAGILRYRFQHKLFSAVKHQDNPSTVEAQGQEMNLR